jgi:hypothetical protein
MSTQDLKTIALVAVGVIVAGMILNYGRDIKLLEDAHDGFDYANL